MKGLRLAFVMMVARLLGVPVKVRDPWHGAPYGVRDCR